MSSRITELPARLLIGALATLALLVLLRGAPIRALPEAGIDVLEVGGEVTVVSRLGTETIPIEGTITIQRGDPTLDGGVEVADAQITAMDLVGTSVTGDISISQSPIRDSLGELRSLQPPPDQFPASSFFDVFIEAAAPGSPSPIVVLHNDLPLHVVPTSGGGEVPLTAWPPVGVAYAVEPEPCVPLLPVLPAEVCVTGLSLVLGGTPPQAGGPTFAVAPDGPSGLHPAEIIGRGAGARPAVPCDALGLTADGCDDGSDGDRDEINALSFGVDFFQGDTAVLFSVGPGSTGLSGTGVAGQAGCSPAEPQADLFASSLDGANTLRFDGNGQNGGCPLALGLGLIEGPTADDLDALEDRGPAFIDATADGIPDEAVLFSLSAGSPSLAAFGRSASDVLFSVGGIQPGLYASGASLGLQPGDDVDALCVGEAGSFDPFQASQDQLLFSLASGSPSLASLGADPADILAPGPTVTFPAADLGLQQGDDLDAMTCGLGGVPPPPPTPTPTAPPPPVQPPNDDFGNAMVISQLPFSDFRNTILATDQTGEPFTPCGFSGLATIGQTVWFVYTAPIDQTLAADTEQSDFDTVLAVYTGETLAALQEVACDDDSGFGLSSLLTFEATAGVTYLFQVGGFRANTGNLVFSLTGDPLGPPTATPTDTATPTPDATSTPLPTLTLTPTSTFTPETPTTETLVPSSTPTASVLFLPETGVSGSTSGGSGAWPLFISAALAILAGAALLGWGLARRWSR